MRSLALALALTLAPSALAVPGQLSHQGALADADGLPLEGVHSLAVSIYAASSGGAALWTDAVDANFEGGAYSVVLGANPSNPLPPDIFDGSVRYVSLAVDDTPELPERLPLTSVPYAVRAGVAHDVQGGVADVSELRVNGATVITGDGALAVSVAWDDITGAPEDADTLGDLACATDEIPVWNGIEWACGSASPSSLDVSALNGTIAITNLPVGTGSGQIAAGDHTHGFGQITGVAAATQLPVGNAANQVAAGDHGHAIADLSGNLPLSRTTGDLPISRTTGDLPISRTTGSLEAARLTGTVALSNLPVGSSASTVSRGDHTHDFNALSGTAALSQLPVGTSSSTVARGDHTHAFSAITGAAALSQLPVGTTSTTVARGDHGHDISALSGTAALSQLPVGTSSSTVARGDHSHAFSAITGAAAKAQLPADTVYASCSGAGDMLQWTGSSWACRNFTTPQEVFRLASSSWSTASNGWQNLHNSASGTVTIGSEPFLWMTTLGGHWTDNAGRANFFRMRYTNQSTGQVTYLPNASGVQKYVYVDHSRLEELTFQGVSQLPAGRYTVQLEVNNTAGSTYSWSSSYGQITHTVR